VKASEFMANYAIGHSVTPVEEPDDHTGHPRFLVRFILPAAHDHRAVHLDYYGAADDDVSTVTEEIAEVFYRMAARYGESYEEMQSDFGLDLLITREQWEQGEKALRERCRAWLPDERMWEEFLSVEIDDDGTRS
jgi:hypothetical protein